jgi:hypothetical protein
VLISADQSFGTFTLMDQTLLGGAGPRRMREGFYVSDAESVGPDDQQIIAGPSTAVGIPQGMAHAFTVGLDPSRSLDFEASSGFVDQSSYLGTPAAEMSPSQDDLPPPDPDQKQTYLNRLRDRRQETMLGEEVGA